MVYEKFSRVLNTEEYIGGCMKPKLGLGIIGKDEVDQIERILKNYSKYFNEIQITITNTSKLDEIKEVCDRYGAIHSFFEWQNDFAKARNYNKALFKESDYY